MNISLYGKYAGRLKNSVNYLNNCSEMELFIQVNALYEPVRMAEHCKKMICLYDKLGDQTSKQYFIERLNIYNQILRFDKPVEHEELIYALDYCILQTNRFNTKVVYNPKGRIIETQEFKNWYNNWQMYIATMDNATLAYYRVCRYESKGLDKFHLDKPVEFDKIISEIESIKPKTYKLTEKSIKQIYA